MTSPRNDLEKTDNDTVPGAASRDYAALLNPQDIHPESVPMVETELYLEAPEFKRLMAHLEDWDYIAFASQRAIEAFAIALEERAMAQEAQASVYGVSASEVVRSWRMNERIRNIRFCAIGQDNDRMLQRLGIQPAFIAEEPSPIGIVHHLQHQPEVKGKRIAVLAPEVIGLGEPDIVSHFLETLSVIGMKAERITAYRTRVCSEERRTETQRKLMDGYYDGVLFTSGTEIQVFLKMVPEGMSTEVFLEGTQVLCYGPYTANVAEKLGVAVDFTSTRYGSFQELVKELEGYLPGEEKEEER